MTTPTRVCAGAIRAFFLAGGVAVALVGCSPAPGTGPPLLTGRVSGAPAEGVTWIVAERGTPPLRVAARTDAEGRYRLPLPNAGPWHVSARGGGRTSSTGPSSTGAASTGDSIRVERPLTLDLSLGAVDTLAGAPSSVWLAALPDGETKRRYILDCTGCHQLNETRARSGGAPRTRERWEIDARRMIGFAGATTGFPVISEDCDPAALATWLTTHLGAEPPHGARVDYDRALAPDPAPRGGGGVLRAVITEYDLPVAGDLPHDVALDARGRVLVTGMFTGVIWRIEPESGRIDTVDIPIPRANPRAIEVDSRGDWWILLGAPKRVARYRPGDGAWSSWEIGMYPHSIAPTADGSAVWFNGHFSRDPELIARLDPVTGRIDSLIAPIHPRLGPHPGGPIPYEARLAPDSTLWISELQGNRILGYHPGRARWTVRELPETWSGPRRFDVAPDGRLWIPGYASGTLVVYDPVRDTFESFRLPIRDSVPYVVRVDGRRGHVWIGTAAADVLYRFDPAQGRFTVVPVPTRGASMRHLAIDPATGDVWVAYGASPAIHPARVTRVRPEETLRF